ncbi:hypothetical protein BD94_3793 [Elizabethkingia anophelis NUHP1]|uniref:Uncharacterized protein n=1 Tax=Elizabethkingia anophelis NUHP1 TaxID=1338011 RepID=A0A077EM52_9FLAO|nr:hypothetical protein BD94_3793 [Elizabethkingia anophelis NUHP1]AKH96021.1 hypothetical protein M876_15810 [Elizabethkingia anophelis FMS-007]EOR31381.1 hypothetical protein L100_00045 [Elizabethkingia meningoseptica ATCC 13253 = NBRC 12535]EQB91156.1 hypothetical protein C874_13670 [Elizabethkingia anophelis 502]KMU65382.1 hypothetical protein EZBTHKR_0151 [Elizabethkingia anophelis]
MFVIFKIKNYICRSFTEFNAKAFGRKPFFVDITMKYGI